MSVLLYTFDQKVQDGDERLERLKKSIDLFNEITEELEKIAAELNPGVRERISGCKR